jgi:hypothetical protein
LVSLMEFDGLTPPVKMNFERTAFWVRMYHLPLACMGKEMGYKIGYLVREVQEVDVEELDATLLSNLDDGSLPINSSIFIIFFPPERDMLETIFI